MAWVVMAAVLGGCASAGEAPARVDALAGSDPTFDPVVLAILDGGVNPYLEDFASSTDWGSMFPEAVRLRLASTGDYGSRVEADAQSWSSIEPGRLYWFEGTRVLGITLDPTKTTDGIRDIGGHGTANAQAAARNSDEIVLLIVQVRESQPECGGFVRCVFNEDVIGAMEWVADQAWIDVVSLSLGLDAPDHPEWHPEMLAWMAATERASASGKLVISAAGNSGVPVVPRWTSGPPWIVSVGGVEAAHAGEGVESAKGGVDVVADFTLRAAFADSTEDSYWTSGTSFAAPAAAGAAAQALHLVRQAMGPAAPPAAALRPALNASATYFTTTQWQPVPSVRGPSDPSDTSLPILVQPQMGWGYVNGSLAPEIARRVIEGDLAIPAGKEQAAAFQPRWQQARQDFWDNYV